MKTAIALATQTGFETWENSSYEFRTFLCKQPGQDYNEVALNVAARDQLNSMVMTVGNPMQHLSAPGRPADRGNWWTTNYQIEEGSILKIVCTMSAATLGDRRKHLQQFYRVRSGAALVRVRMQLPEKIGRSIQDAHIYGRFDLLTLDQALAAGCKVHPKFHSCFDNVFEDVLEFREVEAAITAPVIAQTRTILDAAGGELAVTVERRRRMVRSVAPRPVD